MQQRWADIQMLHVNWNLYHVYGWPNKKYATFELFLNSIENSLIRLDFYYQISV